MSKKSKKPLHLIIDGVDKIGKSTVCKLLSKELGLPIIKMQDMPKFFKKNPEEASEIFNKTIAQFSDFSFICDRGYPTSCVYSFYFNRKYDLSYLDDVQTKLKPKVVILLGQCRDEDELLYPNEQEDIADIYEEYARKSKSILIYVNKLTPKEICKLILKKL